MPALGDRQGGDGYEEHYGRRNLPRLERIRGIRIDGRETRRPECLSQVSCVGDDGIPNTRSEGAIWIDPAAQALRSHGDGGTGRRERKERKLLLQQPGKAFLRKGGARLMRVSGALGRSRHSPQRPVVPQYQHERQGDHLRLGHQSQNVEAV